MNRSETRAPLGTALAASLALALAGYFAFSALQGDHGLFRRMQAESEVQSLQARKAELQAELATVVNLTSRLSDTSLDLDLLDERARVVLGYLRADEVVIQ